MNPRRLLRGGPLAMLVLLSCLTIYYLYEFNQQQSLFYDDGEKGRQLALEMPSIQIYSRQVSPLSSWQLWRMQVPKTAHERSSAVSQIATQSRFAVKDFGGVQALYSLEQQNVRWELYGIVQRNGVKQAVFFNPSLGEDSLTTLRVGQELAEGLRIELISQRKVEIRDLLSAESVIWKLTVFSYEVNR